MDTTLKGIPLNKEKLEEVFNHILNIDIDDGVSFEIISIKDIRLEDEYGGFRLNVLSKLDNNKTYITIEVTTGDEITPKEMKYSYNCIFENKRIPIMAYTCETVLAEKFQTIILRGILNTRLKDFYDIYVLIDLKVNEIDNKVLAQAIINTFKRRETLVDINNFNEVIDDVENDKNLEREWKIYRDKNRYAKDIKFIDTIKSIRFIISVVEKDINKK